MYAYVSMCIWEQGQYVCQLLIIGICMTWLCSIKYVIFISNISGYEGSRIHLNRLTHARFLHSMLRFLHCPYTMIRNHCVWLLQYNSNSISISIYYKCIIACIMYQNLVLKFMYINVGFNEHRFSHTPILIHVAYYARQTIVIETITICIFDDISIQYNWIY